MRRNILKITFQRLKNISVSVQIIKKGKKKMIEEIIQNIGLYLLLVVVGVIGSLVWIWLSNRYEGVRKFDLTIFMVDVWKKLFWKKKNVGMY